MTTGNNTTRRDALCELASLPMIALGKTYTLSSRRYEEMLRFCTAALEACWQLYRGSDPEGCKHAFDCIRTYTPLLLLPLKLSRRQNLLLSLLRLLYRKPRSPIPLALPLSTNARLTASGQTLRTKGQTCAYVELLW